MKQQLVLSVFPGIDLLGRAFEEVWGDRICVVRGPDVIFGGDIRGWHVPAGKFSGAIGGPPCQCFSRLAHMVRHNGYQPKFGNLIPEFERVIMEAMPEWFLMENVPDAPLPVVAGYAAWSTLLNNRQLGEAQNRVRRFTFGMKGSRYKVLMIDTVALESVAFEYCGGDPATKLRRARGKKGTMPWNDKSRRGFSQAKAAQGLTEEFDIPAFTMEAKCHAVRNGVPMAMGRALAKAVLEAVEQTGDN